MRRNLFCFHELLQRRAWDSNPQPLAGHLISSQEHRFVILFIVDAILSQRGLFTGARHGTSVAAIHALHMSFLLHVRLYPVQL